MAFQNIIDLLLLGLISVSISYQCYSSYLVWKFLYAVEPAPDRLRLSWPGVSIIKPVAGMDRESYENFASFCRQDYPRYEVVFACSDRNDSVIGVIQKLQVTFPDVPVRIVIANHNRGPNYKVGNLQAAVENARHRVLVMSDSDMRVAPDYLKTVVNELPSVRPGLVTCLYRNIQVDSIGSILQALTLETSFLPNVLFDRHLHGLSYAFGATLCTTKEALQSIGGIGTLRNHLADDYQIGQRLHRQGCPVRLAPMVIGHVSNLTRFRDYFIHQLRWAVTQKVCRPAGYRASILIQSVILAALYLGLHPVSSHAWLLFALVALIRSLTASAATAGVGPRSRSARTVRLIPLNDLLNGVIYLVSLFTRTVHWHGRRFRVLQDGRMIEADRASA